MRTRHTMTLFLVLTLLTNLAHHEQGSVTASGVVEKGEFTARRRILDRLIRQGLASSDRQQMHSQTTSQQHLYPAKMLRRPQYYSLLQQVIQSNSIPSNRNWGQEEELPTEGLSNSSSVASEIHNYYSRDSGDNPKNLPALMRQHELSWNEEDSLLRRRHAGAADGVTERPLAKARKERKMDRQRRRQDKKNKRSKEKSRRRKQNKRLKELLESEDVILHNIDGEEYLDCCPSKLIVVEKQVGKDRQNHAVEVRPSQQYFYERVCLPDIEEKECVFPARSLRKGVITRCAQQFSYVQAHVRPYRSEEEWRLDYIYVRSGCSCQVSVSPRKKRNKNKKQ